MTPDTREWQRASAYDYLDESGADDLAWECLRRNTDYQSDYASYLEAKLTGRGAGATTWEDWGLRFPGPPRSQRFRANRILDARSRHHGHPYRFLA